MPCFKSHYNYKTWKVCTFLIQMIEVHKYVDLISQTLYLTFSIMWFLLRKCVMLWNLLFIATKWINFRLILGRFSLFNKLRVHHLWSKKINEKSFTSKSSIFEALCFIVRLFSLFSVIEFRKAKENQEKMKPTNENKISANVLYPESRMVQKGFRQLNNLSVLSHSNFVMIYIQDIIHSTWYISKVNSVFPTFDLRIPKEAVGNNTWCTWRVSWLPKNR